MPRWDGGELPESPVFRWRNWTAIIGPSVVMAAAAIGGGEWLTGPQVTARFGPALLWLSAFSILGQVIYNIEISRYALYTGEPIFTGKFRTLPGPMFWLCIYLVLDCGSFLPYLASSAAIPLAGMILQRMPDLSAMAPPESFLTLGGQGIADVLLVRLLGCCIFLGVLLPLLVGG